MFLRTLTLLLAATFMTACGKGNSTSAQVAGPQPTQTTNPNTQGSSKIQTGTVSTSNLNFDLSELIPASDLNKQLGETVESQATSEIQSLADTETDSESINSYRRGSNRGHHHRPYPHRYPRRHYPHHYPRYPRYPRPYPWPNGYGFVTCYAQNHFGQIFYGHGFPVYMANQAALNACYMSSYSCFSLGCR